MGRKLTRRQVIRLGGAAATASLLVGCGSTPRPTPTPTAEPLPASAQPPVPTETLIPTDTPASAKEVRRPEIVQFYPDVPSKVIQAHHSGVWDGEELVPGALRQMLDASIVELTGLSDASAAWAALFAPEERIAIKVNTFSARYSTRLPLVMAVVEALKGAGIPPEQIVVFDNMTALLEYAGYPINKEGPGLRCYGDDDERVEGWTLIHTSIKLSSILLDCDALINIPILKGHTQAGITFAMKNHFGTFDRPSDFHGGQRIQRGIAELNALPPIRDRTRLIVGDALAIVDREWSSTVKGDSILMSFDPIAHDTTGLQLFCEAMEGEGPRRASTAQATPWLEKGAALGLGAHEPGDMELVEIAAG